MNIKKCLNTLNNKYTVNVITLNIYLSIFFILFYNTSFILNLYKTLESFGNVNIIFLTSLLVFFFGVFYIFFSLLTFKYIEKPLLIITILISSAASYYSFFYNVTFDPEMFVNIFETHKGEATSYFNSSIISWFLITGIAPSLLILKLKIQHYSLKKEIVYKALSCLLCILILIITFFSFSKELLSVKKNNRTLHQYITPIFHVKSFIKFVKASYLHPIEEYRSIGVDAKINSYHLQKKNLLVIAVGETARSQNHHYNGYQRETTPFTEQKNTIVFQNVSSCGTATATSVPCIFSRLDRKNFSRNKAKSEDNLVDIISRTTNNISWLDNDAGCKGVCKKIKHFDIPVEKDGKYCNDYSCHDEVLLKYLQKELDSFDSKDTVIVLHLIGSHGPSYSERYPKQFRKFYPECQRSDIQNCTSEELINSYDNTILYTDFVLSKIIESLQSVNQKWNTGLIYVSDHGESLGESNLYFHGSPYFVAPKEQTKVPMIMWFSESFIKYNKINIGKLKNRASKEEYSHDNIFDSVLGLMNISTEIYNKNLDILHSVKEKR